jgi:ABC-type phosphate transport system substrate-binding protein
MTDFVSFVVNGQLFVAGGYLQDYALSTSAYQYQSNGQWTTLTDSLKQTRGDATAAVLAGKAYITGGWSDSNNWAEGIATIEEFDPVSKTFSLLSDDVLVPGRGDAALCNIRGRLFVFGGESPSWNPRDEVEVLSLDYNSPEASDWHYAGELPVPKFRFGCASTTPTSIHVFGGMTKYNSTFGHFSVSTRVDEFVEVRIFEDIESRLLTQLHISGSSNAAQWLWTTAHIAETMSRSPVRITYRVSSTVRSQSEFVGAPSMVTSDDTNIGDAALSSQLFNLLNPIHKFVQIPLALTSIRVVYNLQLKSTAAAQLVACDLAKIFSGKKLKWSNVVSNIAGGVPNIDIVPFRQANDTSETAAFVAYLQKACPAEFSLPAFQALPQLSSKSPPTDVSGSITYAYKSSYDAGTGFKFEEAALRNADGKFLTADQADLRNSVPSTFSSVEGDLSSLSFIDASGVTAWPIVNPVFAYVRTDQTGNGQTGQLLKAYLTFLLSDRAQMMANTFGHSSLPPYWNALAIQGVGKINVAADSTPYLMNQPVPEQAYSLMSSREDQIIYDQVALSQLQSLVFQKTQSASDGGGSSASTASVTNATNIAIAGLVIAIFAFLLSVYAACKIRGLGKHEPAGVSSAANYSNSIPAPSRYTSDKGDHITTI